MYINSETRLHVAKVIQKTLCPDVPNRLRDFVTEDETKNAEVWARTLASEDMIIALASVYPGLYRMGIESLEEYSEAGAEVQIMRGLPNTALITAESLKKDEFWEILKSAGITHYFIFGIIPHMSIYFRIGHQKVKDRKVGLGPQLYTEVYDKKFDPLQMGPEEEGEFIFSSSFELVLRMLQGGEKDFVPAFIFVLPQNMIKRRRESHNHTDSMGLSRYGDITVNEHYIGLNALIDTVVELREKGGDYISLLPPVIFAAAGPGDYTEEVEGHEVAEHFVRKILTIPKSTSNS